MNISGAACCLLLLTLCNACGSASNLGDRLAGRRASPFALFGRDDMRAGMRFDVLRQVATKESAQQFECVALWAKAQRCSVPIESGMLVAILDSTGRIIRLLATTDPMLRSGANVHGQLLFRDVVRDTRAAWDSSGILNRDESDPVSPQLRWLDRTQRWGASLWYSRLHRAAVPRSSSAAIDTELAVALPESIGVTDLPAYALFAQLRPPAATPPVLAPRYTPPPRPLTRDEILTMLQSDLRELTIAEEGAVHETGQYETQLGRLHLTVTAGVELRLVRPTADGWSAIATQPALPGISCVVFAGDVSAPPTTQRQHRQGAPGEVVCDQP